MIDQELREAISAHALTEYPKECCGLVVRGKYIPCRNVAADPFADVALAPEDFAAAEDIGPIEAFVHSHPGSTAEPTQADLTVCENGDAPLWIIASLGVQSDGTIAVDDWCEFRPKGYDAPLVGCEFSHGVNDCYGLVRRWYRQRRGIILPDFPRDGKWWDDGKSDLYTTNYPQAGFESIPNDREPEIGDVVLMKIRSRNNVPNHAAVYVGNGKILHHLWGELSRHDLLARYREYVTHLLRYRGGNE